MLSLSSLSWFEIAFYSFLTYVLIGVFLITSSNLRNKALSGFVKDSFYYEMTDSPKPSWIAIGVFLFAFFGLCWPLILADYVNEKWGQKKQTSNIKNLLFEHAGGTGEILCMDCGYSENIVAFLRYVGGCSTGHQCQKCGQFKALSYRDPFDENSFEAKVQHARSIIDLIERQMQQLPKRKWLDRWEEDLREHKGFLENIPEYKMTLISQSLSQANSEFEAQRQCECGGVYERSKALFCPSCKGKALRYLVQALT